MICSARVRKNLNFRFKKMAPQGPWDPRATNLSKPASCGLSVCSTGQMWWATPPLGKNRTKHTARNSERQNQRILGFWFCYRDYLMYSVSSEGSVWVNEEGNDLQAFYVKHRLLVVIVVYLLRQHVCLYSWTFMCREKGTLWRTWNVLGALSRYFIGNFFYSFLPKKEERKSELCSRVITVRFLVSIVLACFQYVTALCQSFLLANQTVKQFPIRCLPD